MPHLTADDLAVWRACVAQRDALVKGFCRGFHLGGGGLSSGTLANARAEAAASYPFMQTVSREVADPDNRNSRFRYNAATDVIEVCPKGMTIWFASSGRVTRARALVFKDLIDNPTERKTVPDPEPWY